MTVLQRFKIILQMREETLCAMVDMYNNGTLSPESAEALEAVEAMYDSDQKKEV